MHATDQLAEPIAARVIPMSADLKPRILFLINTLGGGGAERSLMDLLPFYEAAGVRPVIACLRRREEGVENEAKQRSIDVRYSPRNSLVGWTRWLRKLIRTEPFDLVHTTIFESDIAGRIAAVGSNVPVLTSLVNTSYAEIRLSDPKVNRRRLHIARMIDGWTGRHLTAHFHAITHAVKDSAIRDLGLSAERITVIERGRDMKRLGNPSGERRKCCRDCLDLSDEDEVIVNVGRQEYQKGQKYLLEAFSQIASKRPNAKLVIVGRRGHASDQLEELRAELNLGDRVRFLGHRDDVPDILASADVFAFPSLYEGQGGALIEAMALGLPIVATTIPSTREVSEEGGNAVLVPPMSVGGLAAAIQGLLENPTQMKVFGERGRAIFFSRFTIERSADRMLGLYRALITARF